jgi:hypothetical protein
MSDVDDDTVAGEQPPLSYGAKKRANRQKKRAQASAKKAESIAILTSNEDDSSEDYPNFVPLPDPENTWTPPARDFWEPQHPAVARFKTKAPVWSHQPSQKEVVAKYTVGNQCSILGRIKVIRLALAFQNDTEFMQDVDTVATKLRYNIEFTAQDYLDFATVSDI